MAIFNSYVKLPQGKIHGKMGWFKENLHLKPWIYLPNVIGCLEISPETNPKIHGKQGVRQPFPLKIHQN
jgi:hypothetical protein